MPRETKILAEASEVGGDGVVGQIHYVLAKIKAQRKIENGKFMKKMRQVLKRRRRAKEKRDNEWRLRLLQLLMS